MEAKINNPENFEITISHTLTLTEWKQVADAIREGKNNLHRVNSFKMHEMTGKQYFIIPRDKNSLIIVDNNIRKNMNKYLAKEKKPIITAKMMYEMAYYATTSKGLVR